MKYITRMLIFSAVALYLTVLWNHGFTVNFEPTIFIRTVLLIAFFYYLILPISKVIMIPINFLTLGLLSSLFYFLLFYFFITHFTLVKIKPWDFAGLHFYFLNLPKFHINYLTNIGLVSVSLSFIINLLELVL